jgi:DNA-directed RNA polymerase specialized sigma24 family protein
MSLPRDDSARGYCSDEELEEYRRRLIRYWKKRCPHLAEDLADLGVIQIWLIGVSGWRGKNKAKPSTYLQSVGLKKGIDGLRKELRNQRDIEIGGQFLTNANIRMLQNPRRYEEAIISIIDAPKDDDYQKMAAKSVKRGK